MGGVNGVPPVVPPGNNGPGKRFLAHLHRAAEWYSVAALVLAGIVWLALLPQKRPVYREVDLENRLVQAQKSGDTAAAQERERDLAVWNRYEEELRLFEWGKNINWYLFASLRVLVIVLGAITPALIVSPAFEKKKFVAALPAAIVAIGTGFISEFDFRMEAARYGEALARLQSEKTAFISQSPPLYGLGYAAPAAPAGNSQPQRQTQIVTDVPFPYVSEDRSEPYYPQARANFAYRIEQIFGEEANEREKFLRGEKTRTAQQPSGRSGGGSGQPNEHPNPPAKTPKQ